MMNNPTTSQISLKKRLKKLPLDGGDWVVGSLLLGLWIFYYYFPESFNKGHFYFLISFTSIFFLLSFTIHYLHKKKNIPVLYPHPLSYPHEKWPSLPKDQFILGRSATVEDVKIGDAVFYTESSQPAAMPVPQYGLLKGQNSDEDTPILIIQAEWLEGEKVLGAINLHQGHSGCINASEVTTLGNRKPKFWPPLKEKGPIHYEPRGILQISLWFTLISAPVVIFTLVFVKIFGTAGKIPSVIAVLSIVAMSYYACNKYWPEIKKKYFLKD